MVGQVEFETTVESLLSSKESLSTAGAAAGKYIRDNLGATDRIYNEIFAHLS